LLVADTDGVDAITIRRLAQDFEVTPMALYWHFANKDELLAAIGDRVLDDVHIDPADTLSDYLRNVIHGLVDALRVHPGVAQLAASRILSSDHGIEITDQVLGRLYEEGMSRKHAAAVARASLQAAILLVTGLPGSESTIAESERDAIRAQKREALRMLPAERFPHIAASADALLDCDDEQAYYDEGIELFVSGLANASGR
jgi:AcrR family transcriptional regulator